MKKDVSKTEAQQFVVLFYVGTMKFNEHIYQRSST